MTYHAVAEMVASQSLRERINACVAGEGISSPEGWASSNIWKICAAPAWDDQWDYAKATYQINLNPDMGARTDVISDQDILSSVQAVVAAA